MLTRPAPTSFPTPRAPVAAVIVAAGRGERAGGETPKQYRPVSGRCALERTLSALLAHPRIDHVAVAIRPSDTDLYEAAAARARARVGGVAEKLSAPVYGGAERQQTVRAVLEALARLRPSFVLVHDAARLFLPEKAISSALDGAEAVGAACAALPAVDTMRRETAEGLSGALVEREGLWRAQTPQAFAFSALLDAHRRFADTPVTDDAELIRLAGLPVALTDGAPELFKLTTPADFDFAERLAPGLDRTDGASPAKDAHMPIDAAPISPDIRVGAGFDVHRFGPNADGSEDHVMLCGVAVPHDAGLVGHSDADVALHALTDAVLAAAGLGDIGTHFPPTDPAWRGASSDQFLADAVRRVGAEGGRPTLLDVTLICERPKIGPHAAAMRARVAEIAGLPLDRISVKATTSEGLGFTGRREGIAAMASATVLFSEPRS